MTNTESIDLKKERGLVFDIQRYAVHDGPGIRTLVFLSGCPLSCLWCQNPEGRVKRSVLLYYKSRCTSCMRCVGECPEGAISVSDEGGVSTNFTLCILCGRCVDQCPAKARTIAGTWMFAPEVCEVVEQDRSFYRRSGGGVTLSGGEPLMQPSFARAVLALCRERYIGTALETCGYAEPESVRLVVEHADTVLYDIKHIDPSEHQRLTGVDNGLILENARLVAGMDLSFVVRVPVIPGYNDDDTAMISMARFVRNLENVIRVDLLPYHRFGEGKYQALGITYPLEEISDPDSARMNSIKRLFEERGLEVRIEGIVNDSGNV